jgi:hypothetical protein
VRPDPQKEAVLALYQGAGMLPLTREVAVRMTRPVDPKTELGIKPSGEIYMEHMQVRRRLNEAFGVGQWALIPASGVTVHPNGNKGGKRVMREFVMVVNGQFAAQSIGGMVYHPTNPNMGLDDALEGAESDALKRCAKKLGIGAECWDKREAYELRKTYCIQVRAKDSYDNITIQWRVKDGPPLPGEIGVADPKTAPAPGPAVDGEFVDVSAEPASQSAPERTPRTVDDGEAEMVKAIVAKCPVKREGVNAKTNKPWKIYAVTTTDGTIYETFSDSIAKSACEFARKMVPVNIYFTRKEFRGQEQFACTAIEDATAAADTSTGGEDPFGEDNGGGY